MQLDEASIENYCSSSDVDEAWSLAMDKSHVMYLRADRSASSGQDPLTGRYTTRHP